MTQLLLLYLLAVVDGAFVGYRDAVGRNPLLDKRDYYRRAFLYGVALAHVALVAIGIAAGATWLAAPDRFAELLPAVAGDLLRVYGVYAVAVMLVFGAYRIPSYDVRSFITISAFGALTLTRPFVIIGGAVVAGLRAADPLVWPTLVTVSIAMGCLQPLLARLGPNDFDWQTL